MVLVVVLEPLVQFRLIDHLADVLDDQLALEQMQLRRVARLLRRGGGGEQLLLQLVLVLARALRLVAPLVLGLLTQLLDVDDVDPAERRVEGAQALALEGRVDDFRA